jgi:hypothetical protein
LCQRLSEKSKADNIEKYRKEMLLTYPQIPDVRVLVPRFGLTLNPWEQWHENASPFWWRAYNNVKHRRHTHFAEANLKNSLNAVAGLFVLLLFFYREEGQNGLLIPDPAVFRAGPPFVVDHAFYAPHATIYQLALD